MTPVDNSFDLARLLAQVVVLGIVVSIPIFLMKRLKSKTENSKGSSKKRKK